MERPTNTTFAAVLVGGVHDLLHAVHVAGEAGHDDLASGLCERLVERRTDGGLRLDEARDLGVGGVHHQKVPRPFAKLAEFHQIGDAVVERQLVELMSPVSISEPGGVCTNTASASGMECVTFTNSRLNGPTLSLSRPFDLDERRVDAVFLALGLNEGEGELGTDQRNVRAGA